MKSTENINMNSTSLSSKKEKRRSMIIAIKDDLLAEDLLDISKENEIEIHHLRLSRSNNCSFRSSNSVSKVHSYSTSLFPKVTQVWYHFFNTILEIVRSWSRYHFWVRHLIVRYWIITQKEIGLAIWRIHILMYILLKRSIKCPYSAIVMVILGQFLVWSKY